MQETPSRIRPRVSLTSSAERVPRLAIGGSNQGDPLDALRLRYESLLKSADFVRSERLSSLLLHLLHSWELGTTSRLNERSIGMDVFGREPDWDPAIDPCVRVAMGRLRTKLGNYYQNAGRNDAVRITLNKGSYLPQLVPFAPAVEKTDVRALQPNIDSVHFRHYGVWGGATAALVLLLTTFGLWAKHDWAAGQSAGFTVLPFSTEPGIQSSPAISPDGRCVAYVWDGNQGHFHLYLKPTNGGHVLKLTEARGNDFYPAWSPDGTHIAFLRNEGWEGKLLVKPIAGGNEVTVATITTAPGRWTEDSDPLLGNPGPVWSSDGRELIVFDQGHLGIYSISVQTGERHQLTSTTQTTRDFYPRLSPDGRFLAFVHYVSHGVGDVYVLAMRQGAKPRRLTQDRSTIRGIAWGANGKSLVMASNRTGQFELWRLNVPGGELAYLPSDSSRTADPDISRHDDWIAFDNTEESTNIQQATLSDPKRPLELRPLVSSSGRNHDGSVSPDGRKLAFVSDRTGSWQIWVSSSDGSDPKPLTQLKGSYIGGLSWSPDNRSIAYDARPGGHSSLFLLNVETAQSQPISVANAEERAPSWSPDGTQLYFSSDRNGTISLYRMEIGTGKTTLIAAGGFRGLASEDGRWVYFSTVYGVLWRVATDGSSLAVVPPTLQPYSSLSWTVVGDDLIILNKSTNVQGQFELWQVDAHFKSTLKSEVKSSTQTDILSIGASPDGRSVLAGTLERMTSEIMVRRNVRK